MQIAMQMEKSDAEFCIAHLHRICIKICIGSRAGAMKRKSARVCIDFDADTMQNISDVFVPFLHRLRSDAEICISTMQMQSASFCIKSASDLVPVCASIATVHRVTIKLIC